MMNNKRISLSVLLLAFTISGMAQKKPAKDWHMLDYEQNGVYGISVNKAYKELLGNKTGSEVIVAVIDSGVDTLHEDLKSVLWTNVKDDSNGGDSNKNGYFGDVHGWNFLGRRNNMKSYVVKDSEEDQRIYFKYQDRFDSIPSQSKLSDPDKKLYQLWLDAKASIERKMFDKVKGFFEWKKLYDHYDVFFQKELGKPEYTMGDVANYSSVDSGKMAIKAEYLKFAKGVPPNITGKQYYLSAFKQYNAIKKNISFPVEAPVDYRSAVTGDNYYDIQDRFYGNSNLRAEKCSHGTHVAGIIGAVRNNGIGIDGIVANVKLMTIRAVPDGDEHDKDIALAIRYAVDNGASIINMSFGKSISPERQWVEEAIRYAEQKNVLIVKAAGNDGQNIDSIPSYPSAWLLRERRKAKNIITVGASTIDFTTNNLVAPFSNYGKHNVDVFAPGLDIFSTVQGVNTYEAMSGTSMAAPVVAGLAALIKSYYPNFSAVKIKQIIESSVVKIEQPVGMPGSKAKTSMKNLCVTGGIVNAFSALKLAGKMATMQ